MNHDIVALGDVCEFLDSQRVPITESDRKPGPYPYYGANGQQDSIDNYIFDEPLVLLAEDGGYFGSKDRPIAYKVTGKCWVNNHAHVLRPKSNIDVDYLHRVLSYYDVTKYVNGTTRQKLTKGNAENISFPLPPLTEQKRIASLLARADRLRHLRRTAHELGESLLQSVFLEMFGDGSKFDRVEFEELLEEDPKNGLYLSSDQYGSGTPIIRIDAFYDGVLGDPSMFKRLRATEKQIEEFKVQNGEILINRVNSLEYLGKCALVKGLTETTLFESNMMRIRINRKLAHPIYVTKYLTTQSAYSQIMQKAKKAVNQASINQQDVKSLVIPVPPLNLQEEFAGVVARVESLRGRMSEGERQVDGLFESLLSQSFSS